MSLDSYSQIEEDQTGSQEKPGFHGKAWDQVHGHFSSVNSLCFRSAVSASPCWLVGAELPLSPAVIQ